MLPFQFRPRCIPTPADDGVKGELRRERTVRIFFQIQFHGIDQSHSFALCLAGREAWDRDTNLPTSSEHLVRAVAERRGLSLLALAQSDLFFLRHRKLDRREPGSFMRPVAKWLIFRASAATPVVGARIQRKHRRLLSCNDRFFHELSSSLMCYLTYAAVFP